MQVVAVAALLAVIAAGLWLIIRGPGSTLRQTPGSPSQFRFRCGQCGYEWTVDREEMFAKHPPRPFAAGPDCPKCGAAGAGYLMARCPKCGGFYDGRALATQPAGPGQTPPICPHCKAGLPAAGGGPGG